MLFKYITLVALGSVATAVSVSQEVSAATMISNIERLTTLTRIGTSIYQYVVYVNNAPANRFDTISIIGAIGTQGTLDQDLMTGNACGTLTKRFSGSKASRASTYTPEEQANVTSAYSTFVNVTQAFVAAASEKHYAVEVHNAAYEVGHVLNSTYAVLDIMTDSVMSALPSQKDAMMTQKNLLAASYKSVVALYLDGAN